ncbi:MAG: hypothetical protein KF797_09030 [Flavobacteriales bacterium]|nr:hypothetical protein [Flavobacteriales bacterium]
MQDLTTSSLYSEDLAPVPPAKRTWGTWNYAALWIGLAWLLSSCGDRVDVLSGKDFSDGDWLLVRWDVAHHIIHVIDDEKVLAANADGISVRWQEGHGWTTCDGALRLFKNGEEVLHQSYLDGSYLSETSALQKAFVLAEEVFLDSENDFEFTRLWDSLKTVPGNYPTRYHTQPADKDIIWLYRYE